MASIQQIKQRVKQFGLVKSVVRLFYGKVFSKLAPAYEKYVKKHYPVDQNKVLWWSYPAFSDNAKYLFDYYCKVSSEYNHVWLITEATDFSPISLPKTVFIKGDSQYHKGITFKAIKEINTAGLIYYTHNSPMNYCKKRDGQLVINLWHGCGYKDVQKSSSEKKMKFDYALVPGKVFIDTKASFWDCNKSQIWDIGYPRYDLFFNEDKKASEFAEKIKGDNKKIIIWMPTFRKTVRGYFPEEQIGYNFDIPLLSGAEELEKLNDYCHESKIVIVIKRHPKQLSYSVENREYSNIKFMDNKTFLNEGVELYSFLRYTDAIISDYSSITVDYLLLNKPMAFSLDDFNSYKDARGFVFENPLDYMPGYHLYSSDDLLSFVTDISDDKDIYADLRKEKMPEMHNICKDYCQRIYSKVTDILS